MLAFEQPAALWLLLTLLLLLMVRRVPPRRQQPVANLHLWAAIDQTQQATLTRRLRRHRLSALHALFIIFVVLALAQPQVAFSRHHVAVIVDTSMSMGALENGRRRIDIATDQVLARVRGLSGSERVSVYLAGPNTELLGAFSPVDPELQEQLASVQPSDAIANLDAAIQRARGAQPVPARIYVLTDTKVSVSTADIDWVRVGTPVNNVAITALTASRDVDGRAVHVLAGVTNYGTSTASGEIAIEHEQRVLARRALSLPAKGTASFALPLPPLTGVVRATLRLTDALDTDNTRQVVVSAPATTQVLLIGSSPLVEQALAVLPGFAVATESTSADVVICAACSELPREHQEAGVLMLPAPSSSETSLAAIIVTADVHPLLRDVNASGLHVAPFPNTRTLDESSVLMRAGGHPVLAAYSSGTRRVVEMRFDPARSPMTAHPAFPLLVAASMSWLADDDREEWSAGQPLQIRSAEVTRVIGPDGQTIPHVTSHNLVSIDRTEKAGIYRLQTPSGNTLIAVNPATDSESNLADAAEASTLPALPAPPAPPAPKYALDPWLLLGALAILGIESRVRRPGRA